MIIGQKNAKRRHAITSGSRIPRPRRGPSVCAEMFEPAPSAHCPALRSDNTRRRKPLAIRDLTQGKAMESVGLPCPYGEVRIHLRPNGPRVPFSPLLGPVPGSLNVACQFMDCGII